jgi:hypothetical protein
LIYFTYINGFDIKTWQILSMQNIILKFPVNATCFFSKGSQNSSDLMTSHNLSAQNKQQTLPFDLSNSSLITLTFNAIGHQLTES